MMKWKVLANRTGRGWAPAAHAKAQWCGIGGPMRVRYKGIELWKPLPAAPGEHTPAIIVSYRGNRGLEKSRHVHVCEAEPLQTCP